ncbi:hypothetical protein IFM89_005624 [Coptis chinensis]|uniref:Di19 zinc-binding domain-containing protein n=1 Tax=Coptis chinensis TaxID=261450 RepID=A0A835LQG6_9MAGN|nr:hypothetical protein IFM89_005624 [Coptis chinensis]
MESDSSWTTGSRLLAATTTTTSSKRYPTSSTSLQAAKADLCLGYEEFDDEDDVNVNVNVEFPCPFCTEDFDIIGLCCHIDDEHPAEAKDGVCPVCGTRVGMDMVGHIAMQHAQYFKISFFLSLTDVTVY